MEKGPRSVEIYPEVERPAVGRMSVNTVDKIEEFARGEVAVEEAKREIDVQKMAEKGIFSEKSPEMDLTGNNEVSDTEEMMYGEAMKEMGVKASVLSFNDRGQEHLSKEAVDEVEAAIVAAGDDMAALNTKADDMSWTLLQNAYNRQRGEGLKA